MILAGTTPVSKLPVHSLVSVFGLQIVGAHTNSIVELSLYSLQYVQGSVVQFSKGWHFKGSECGNTWYVKWKFYKIIAIMYVECFD